MVGVLCLIVIPGGKFLKTSVSIIYSPGLVIMGTLYLIYNTH